MNITTTGATTPGTYTLTINGSSGEVSESTSVGLTVTKDTQPPTAPANLTATWVSATWIHLSWTASMDNVGVTNYQVEQCQGSGCSNFAQVATVSGAETSFSALRLSASTTYSYRVRAVDSAGNLSGYSNTASATTKKRM
jgi:predicted phage tail protein